MHRYRHPRITRSKTLGALLCTVVVATLTLPPAGAYPRPGFVYNATDVLDLLHLRGAGGPYWASSISADGRFVAFALQRTLPSQVSDIFVYDVRADEMMLVSQDEHGVPATVLEGDVGSHRPSISADGRFVAYESDAIDLVVGDTNGVTDIFLYDRKTGETQRVSVASDGSQTESPATHGSEQAFISANGRNVAFHSTASDLVDDDGNASRDVFVHDRTTGQTERVNEAPDGSEAVSPLVPDLAGYSASLSASGRYVAFSSAATNLVDGDNNQNVDVFVKDRKTGAVDWVSRGDGSPGGGGGGTGSSGGEITTAAISANGRYVTFHSGARGHVPNDTNGPLLGMDIFVYDRDTKRTRRLSVTSFGEEVPTAHTDPLTLTEQEDASISADGRYVVFTSTANDLAPGDTGGYAGQVTGHSGDPDVFIHDLKTGATEMVDSTADGRTEASCDNSIIGTALRASVDGSGRFVSFQSCAGNLTSETDSLPSAVEAIHEWDVFVRDRGLPLGAEAGGSSSGPDLPDDLICIIPDVCIPPGGSASVADAPSDVSAAVKGRGADLWGTALAYRPLSDDLFVAIEVEDMPSLSIGAAGMFSTAGSPPIMYGLRFDIAGTSYEVRVTSLRGGTFGLFDCTNKTDALCTKMADLRGGYGTTGERAVFSLPLAEIGLANGGELHDVEAFSSIGAGPSGATKILDRVRID